MTAPATTGGGRAPRPSAALDRAAWARAHDELIAGLRDLIRIRTVNPPGDEILAARHLEAVLADAGIPSTVVEPFPGRGSIVARLRGDGTGGAPLLLLSHLDVVPAPGGGWSHDPFGGDLADGYVWGRGAIDMKGMVAMEVAVMRLLAAEARAAGRDPASDPVPGLTRDVIFASTADEEAGGVHGAGWMVEQHPDWLAAAGALNECGGVAVTVAGTRLWPIQVAEKGFAIYDLEVRGRWGHGSMPGDGGPGAGGTVDGDANALLRAGEVARRLAASGSPRLTPVMERFLEGAGERRSARDRRVDPPPGRRRPGGRGRARRRLHGCLPPGAPEHAPRHLLAGRPSRRDAAQRHPGRRGPDGRHPRPPGHDPGRRRARAAGADRRGALAARHGDASPLGRRRSRPRRGRALGGHDLGDPRGRPRRRPAPGHGPRGRPTPSTRRRSASRPTASRRCSWGPTTSSWPSSTATTSASPSRRSASGCPSSTTSSAASAARRSGARPPGHHELRRRRGPPGRGSRRTRRRLRRRRS